MFGLLSCSNYLPCYCFTKTIMARNKKRALISFSRETNQATRSEVDQSSTESGVRSPKNGAEHDSAATLPADRVVVRVGKQVGKSSTITAALASARHVLDGTDSELVLNPFRLAFDTKNVKVIELALENLMYKNCNFI